jgi:predicted nucleotide-binding protein
LAVRALAIANKSAVSIDQARQWIIHNSQKGFWTFTGGAAGYAATSYAILALTARSDWRELYAKPVQQGLDYLRTGADTAWPNEEEPRVSGDALYNFHHCSLPWAIMAFLAAGTSVFDPIIFKAMDRLYNALYCNNSGGWAEEENHRPGVFATSHAIAALDTFHRALSVEDLLGRYNNQLSAPAKAPQVSHDVFVAHGHDPAVKHQVARFVEQIGCKPIILDEQVDAGLNTIFQKLAQHADKVSYAIVLLTPDDLTQDRTGKQATRARQNAILELGYFIGKLGPENVCVAKKGDVELPSDISGVLYLDLEDGEWKLNLARKLKKAGLPVHGDALISVEDHPRG